ncbi:GNAT family N-acetyltransferase [Cryptosporangium phraense]|uniref:GNAT family N-acetyltransferase n=1 Tax=Cryptosporangium phraense TaxID=2593070 RepID=UPI00197A9E79|nr:GNAT family N-acetyltransferase [Cryptosporangium phraense]
MGFDGVPAAAELEAIERAYAERGAAVQVEVSSLADPGVLELLAGRGYRLVSFENVLGCVASERPDVADVRRSGEDEFEVWLDVVVEASLHPDAEGVAWYEQFSRAVLENAERDAAGLTRRYLARLDGTPAGGGSMHVVDGIAQLTGAGTRPEFRRRGVQSALLGARLTDAAKAGCDVAVVVVQPGSRSHQNAARHGFEVLYTRAVLAL